MIIHNILESSKVNGPGNRLVIWFQGCNIRCKKCFNPETHNFNDGDFFTANKMLRHIRDYMSELDGITISGGEPFDQVTELAEFLKKFKIRWPDKNVICFSGYKYKKLLKNINEEVNPFLYIDLLIAGPYVDKKQEASDLKGSTNQEAIFLTDIFKDNILESDIEFLIDEGTGDMVSTGFPVKEFLRNEI